MTNLLFFIIKIITFEFKRIDFRVSYSSPSVTEKNEFQNYIYNDLFN